MGSLTSAAPKGSGATTPANPLMSVFPMVVVCLILYMLVIRPQQKQAKDHKKMVDDLKTGDKVITQGGIYGTVTGLKGAVVQVKIAENVRVDLSRTAISQILTEPVNGAPPAAAIPEKVS
jgi:preprotein translocase subunit YajC